MIRVFAIMLAMCCISCMKTTIIGASIEEKADTVMTKKPHKPLPPPPIESDDTTRVPIGWNPSVEDWEGTDVDIP